ncbi:glycosyltransferase family 2 protein [Deinococcus cellulosilyticus]|uniref:Glycosyl transferase n=1 Tax=Deinococcus cellulosilyticus (strain DSM 18568 / NBRC 106333 / KACC 11606 / 5516J-15) TaxID=1223518 RepID=A0A511N3F4_DEIC1|nr:glycosyltransferase family 2 protein [Deinococcus cellulosilyticus]GEM47390.1 glycosyl transferase [Deinococcus cellulosilyticus NBRC 106333 = KACC 11606]
MPELTVVIPAYNEEDTIREVVGVARTYAPVIVVCDGCSDHTAERARQAGATVIELNPNQGKSQAFYEGVKAATTDVILSLDADLVGLTTEHLKTLADPVLQGQYDMTIGVFQGGGVLTDFGNRATPYLSGQRAFRRNWMLSVPRLTEERWPEPAITEHLKTSGIRWEYVSLPKVRQVMKEQKRGLLEGVKHRMKMYKSILDFQTKKK